MNDYSGNLDRLTGTFGADRRFFDDLMAQPSGEAFVEMCVWYLWLQAYLHDIQESLSDAGKVLGAEYQTCVVSMIGGAAQCIGMLMYLVSRGVIHEAAASGRRALEYLGVAAHLIRDPSKARHLSEGETSAGYKKAFIKTEPREAERLKLEGIRYRFSGMTMAKSASQLYDIFSRFNVHGGTMSSLVSVAVMPTRNSCGFHNRSLERLAEYLPLFKPILEITALELTELAGRYGTRTPRLNEAGACAMVWQDHNDPRWVERLGAVREDFGLGPASRSN